MIKLKTWQTSFTQECDIYKNDRITSKTSVTEYDYRYIGSETNRIFSIRLDGMSVGVIHVNAETNLIEKIRFDEYLAFSDKAGNSYSRDLLSIIPKWIGKEMEDPMDKRKEAASVNRVLHTIKLDHDKFDAIRANLGFSQAQVASFIGKHRSYFNSNKKNGCKMKKTDIEDIAAFLDCDVEDIIEKDEPIIIPNPLITRKTIAKLVDSMDNDKLYEETITTTNAVAEIRKKGDRRLRSYLTKQGDNTVRIIIVD